MKYNTQETTDGIEFQIKRLQSLRSYPKNDGELIRVAREYTPSVEALRSAITELVERETDCPRPADLRTMLFNRRPQGKRRCELSVSVVSCDANPGSGRLRICIETAYFPRPGARVAAQSWDESTQAPERS